MRVLGIDCGSVRTGYGIVDSDGQQYRLVAAGDIRPPAALSLPEGLLRIAEELRRLIQDYAPQEAAVETVFASINVKSALKLAQVRGVALMEAARAGIPVWEYSPLEVKAGVVGYGRAEKAQVQQMVQAILRSAVPLESEDAADALAIAICHINVGLTQQKLARAASSRG
jgi:crossover junction endodeoxyribonuclease RuvC